MQVSDMVRRWSGGCRCAWAIPLVLRGAMLVPRERVACLHPVQFFESSVGRCPVGCGGRCSGSQPQRRLGWLHGLVDHRQQLAGQGGQVDLVAKVGAEGGDGVGGVVAAAVEAAVDPLLDAAAGRLEGGGYGQGGGGDYQAGVAAQELAEPEHDRGVAAAEQHRQEPVGQGAADDPVKVIEPLAQDRRPGG